MPNVTLFVTDDFKERMNKHPEVRWSTVIRTAIEKKLDDFEEFETLIQKSQITQKDVANFAKKVNTALGKHARKLLNENRS